MPAQSATPAQRTTADSDQRYLAQPAYPNGSTAAVWRNDVPADAPDASDLAARAELGHEAGLVANPDDVNAPHLPAGAPHPRHDADGLEGLEPLLADSPTTTSVDGLVAVRGRRR